MNIDKLKLAKELVQNPPNGTVFDMNRLFWKESGTIHACIAGVCLIHEFGAPVFLRTAEHDFASFLECALNEAFTIMYPEHWYTYGLGIELPHKFADWTVTDALIWLDHWIAIHENKA